MDYCKLCTKILCPLSLNVYKIICNCVESYGPLYNNYCATCAIKFQNENQLCPICKEMNKPVYYKFHV